MDRGAWQSIDSQTAGLGWSDLVQQAAWNTEPNLPETLTLGKLEFQTKGKEKGQRDILNVKWKTMRFLSVCLNLSVSVCVFCFCTRNYLSSWGQISNLSPCTMPPQRSGRRETCLSAWRARVCFPAAERGRAGSKNVQRAEGTWFPKIKVSLLLLSSSLL